MHSITTCSATIARFPIPEPVRKIIFSTSSTHQKKTIIIVDCENSDPYKLCSTLRSLNDGELEKVQKIILYDDIHTSKAWTLIEKYTRLTVEHELAERVNKFISDSFIILSSNSDFGDLYHRCRKRRSF